MIAAGTGQAALPGAADPLITLGAERDEPLEVHRLRRPWC
jgi:hypothetical protein